MSVTAPAPRIETDRLVLRPPETGDWPGYRAFRFSARSPLGRAGMTEDVAWTHFAALFGHWALRGFGRFVIVLRATGAAIGHVGPFRPAGHPEPELTWTLWSAEAEGRGFAFEAAAAARDHVFATLGWPTTVSYITPENARSARLARRLGARPDPEARRPWASVTVWRHRPPEAAR